MTKPDEALLYARERAKRRFSAPTAASRDICAYIDAGKYDDDLSDEAQAYRAGAAASDARIKALEEANAALEDMASRYAIQMSDMLTRLGERYPEDFVWLKEGDQ